MALNAFQFSREMIKVVGLSAFRQLQYRNSLSRKLPILPACDVIHRNFHTSHLKCSNEDKPLHEKRKKGKTSEGKERQVTEEMKTAVRDVAQSMGGDWTKTAEELLARLASHQEPPVKDEEQKPAQPGSLLKTMHVGRTLDDVKAKRRGPRGEKDGLENQSGLGRRPGQAYQLRVEKFTSISSGTRLGIFDAEKVKAALSEKSPTWNETENLWQAVERENMRRMQGSLHTNAFDEMAQLTRQGKMWKFPIDNEQEMHEEKQYKFHDHIFLDKHLKEFPSQGPIRKFMELVVIGLGSNPWLTVPEKIGHIEWYADYFREKEDILVSTIGEQGKMKPKQKQATETQ